MKKEDVQIGATYVARVSGKLVAVRILGASQHGGWDAANLVTRRRIRIRSAARLRSDRL